MNNRILQVFLGQGLNNVEGANDSKTTFVDEHPPAGYEYFVFMLPIFLCGAISFKRIFDLQNETPSYFGNLIQTSYHIKHKLCFVFVVVFIIQLIMAEIVSPHVYWVADYPKASLTYIFGVIGWYLSAKLLEKEVERGIPQQLYTHKLLWVATFGVTIVKMTYDDERKPLPFVLNLCKAIAGFYLTLYTIAKPYDTEEAEAKYNTPDRLPFIRMVLEAIERQEWVQKIFSSIDLTKDDPLLSFRKPSEAERYADEFKDFLKKHKITNYTVGEAADWLKSIPIISCKVVQRINDKAGQDEIKVYYEVRTTCEDEVYAKQHTYANFLDLEDKLKKICNPEKCPWIDRHPPELERTDMKDYNDHKAFVQARNGALEKFLNEIGSDPRFMVDLVVEFLGIQDPHKSAYSNYNAYLKGTHKKELNKKKNQAMGIEMKPTYKPPAMNSKPEKFDAQKDTPADNLPFFSAHCRSFQKAIYGDHYEYIFLITDENDAQGDSWTIVKSYKDFKNFHEKLEKAVGRTIPVFEQYIPKPTSQKQTMDINFVEKRKDGLEKYLSFILKNRLHYKEVLYEFLEYDVAKRSHSSRAGTPRASFYGENLSPHKGE